MHTSARWLAGTITAVAITASQQMAWAQPVPRSPQEVPHSVGPSTAPPIARGQSVLDRQRPEYDAVGIRVGPFFLFPALQVTESFVDNIYVRSSGAVSDFITEIAPTLQVRSNFGRHQLNFDFGAIQRLYLRNSAENALTGILSGQMNVEITSASNLFGGVRLLFGSEPRGSPDLPIAAERPASYRVLSSNLGYSNAETALPFQLTGSVDRYDFENVSLVGGGTLDNENRNRTDLSAAFRIGAALWASVVPFIQASVNSRVYDHADANGIVRDSSGYSVGTGASFDFGGLMTGELFAGYAQQEYRSDTLPTIGGPDVGASLRWNVTPLMTLRFDARTLISETTLSNSSGSIDTRFRFIADYELLRNLLLNLNPGYAHVDYRGISRYDDYYDASIGARYLINNNLSVDASYSFVNRSSNIETVSYDRNAVLVRVRLQY